MAEFGDRSRVLAQHGYGCAVWTGTRPPSVNLLDDDNRRLDRVTARALSFGHRLAWRRRLRRHLRHRSHPSQWFNDAPASAIRRLGRRVVAPLTTIRSFGSRYECQKESPADSYFGSDTEVAVSKVSLSIDEGALAEARSRAGRRELSAYVNEALLRQLQHDRLGELLAEMESESGPISNELMVEARQLWRGPADPSKQRRSV